MYLTGHSSNHVHGPLPSNELTTASPLRSMHLRRSSMFATDCNTSTMLPNVNKPLSPLPSDGSHFYDEYNNPYHCSDVFKTRCSQPACLLSNTYRANSNNAIFTCSTHESGHTNNTYSQIDCHKWVSFYNIMISNSNAKCLKCIGYILKLFCIFCNVYFF